MPIAGERAKAATAVMVIACVAVMSVVASELYRRRRQRLRRQKAEQPDAGQLHPRRRCSEFDEKPQNRFKRVLADNSYSPFKHFKRESKEKEISLQIHPFSTEITTLLENPPSDITFIKEHRCPDMSASFVWVDTTSKLQELATQLSKESVFAVDTEQHSLRSFLGFSALMQISIHEEDYLIDTIALHDSMSILRAVFADPSIYKVFHGADNDILWLQRDFHIYVVNMFDTAKACEILSKPQKSLAYLLETYCGVSTDKTLQREDWRIRPLSASMIQYARTDAHYLLYIADCLMSELQAMTLASSDDNLNFFFEASRRSNMVCLQVYAKEVDSIPGASAAASIISRNLNIEGLSSSCSGTKDRIWILCAWRDLMARIHDESLRYVLSDQAIVAIALKVPKTSTEVYEVISQADLSNGSSSVYVNLQSPSPLINNHLDEICYLLQDTKSDIDEVFRKFLQKHIDPTGCSPLSAYNYALLSEFSLKQTSSSFLKHSVEKCTKMVGKISSRELFVQKFSCKGPVYHNCRIYASDGRLLCYCDRKKLEWYLRRDLAKLVEDDPPAIMLLFEPKGRPEDEDNGFYIQSKKNICVGCGEKNHYLRYRIIPSCYRMHFPEHLKSHRSHDIVLLCVDCHEIAHSAAEKYKRKISKEYGIPLFVQKIVNSGESTVATVETAEGAETGVSPLQLRTAAMALLRHGSDMPEKRVEELMQIVKDYFGREEISREDLEAALLVGMSPQERRRLEKKRGLSFRPNEQNIIYKNGSVSVVELVETNKEDNNGAYISQEPSEDGLKNTVSPQGNLSKDDASAELSMGENGHAAHSRHVEQRKIYLIKPSEDEDSFSSIPDDDMAFSSHKVVSYRTAKKTSLLGHGPHGKQVVEHLLGKYGEDGIHQFCQRWRQVFVDAINPRFLPSGWDILHSGRREFGDHSVYNPARKTS